MSVPIQERTADRKRERWDALRAVLADRDRGPPLGPQLRGGLIPASFAQQRMWLLDRLAPATPTHTVTVAHRLRGPLDATALARALAEVVRRHEALRTSLAEHRGQVVQVVHPPAPVDLPIVDLGAHHGPQRDVELRRAEEKEAAQPFCLDRSPLLRVRLLRLAEGEHHLLVSVHHAAFDGWSFDVFMAELGYFYGIFAGRAPRADLPEPQLQYADYAIWQRRRLQGEMLEPLLAYWTQRLVPLTPTLMLPSDRSRRAQRDRRGASRTWGLPSELWRALKAFSAKEDVTLFTTLVAAFQILLCRYTGEEDIVVGSPFANRNHAELASLIGMFVNTLPLRLSLSGRPSFRSAIGRAREMVAGAIAHQNLPFELLVEAVNPPRAAGSAPLAQVMFAFQNVPRCKWTLPGLAVESWNLESRSVEFDLTLYLEERGDGLAGILNYDSSLFDAWRMEAFLDHYTALLNALVTDPDQPVDTAPLLSPREREQVLVVGNRTTAPYAGGSIHQLFADQARRAPDAIAVVGENGALTYGELDRRANQLARHLEVLGVMPDAKVGVIVGRSPAMIVAILAILKAGAAYVPLEPATAPGRAARMFREAEVALVVTDTASAGELADAGLAVLSLQDETAALAGRSSAPLGRSLAPDTLAYVMFTSGSTGGPKAVAITHRGVVRLARGLGDATPTSQDVVLQFAPVSFDAATFEIWGALLNGATMVLAPSGMPTPSKLGELIRSRGVTTMWLTAGLFELIVDLQPDELAPLRRLLVGGDVVSPAHAARFAAAVPHCLLFNGYGPTENTTFTCLHRIGAADLAEGKSIPIGRPIANTRVYVLDRNLQPVPIGVAGEACIAGDGLARAYLNDPDLTRARFVPDPFDPTPGARLYRTGDRVRQRRDGVLEFLGRDDSQVKIRGFRIELEEVEAALRRCPGIAQAAVSIRGEGAKDKRLVAFYVGTGQEEPLAQMRARLLLELAEPFVPAAFMRLERLPLTANGKIDRTALPAEKLAGSALASADPIEAKMLGLFREVLGREEFGVHNNFFDAGGDSLQAVHLAHLIEEAFGEELPLNALFANQTAADLAGAIRDNIAGPGPDARHPGLVVIRRGGTARPLFIVPGGYGGTVEMTLYARLVRTLPGRQAVYGLCPPDRGSARLPRVPEMAAIYLQAVRRVQRAGPYLLVGECVGGAVAFEMARQLEHAGEAVGALILLESWCPSPLGERYYRWVERPLFILKDRIVVARAAVGDLAFVARGHRDALRKLPPDRRANQLKEAVRSLTRVAANWAKRLVSLTVPGSDAAQRAYVRTLMRYRPSVFSGPVTLIASEASLRGGIAAGWRRWAAGGLVIWRVPGNHDSYLHEHAAATLDRLAAALGEQP